VNKREQERVYFAEEDRRRLQKEGEKQRQREQREQGKDRTLRPGANFFQASTRKGSKIEVGQAARFSEEY